jgi:hypothetical protein
MKASRIVSTAALIALIGGPGAGLSQAMAMEPKAAIQAERMPTPPDVRDRLTEVGRRLQEARLASYSRPLPRENTSRRSMRSREANTEMQ